MTQWTQDFIQYYREQEERYKLQPTPQKVLDLIAGLGEDVVNGKGIEYSVFMLVGMLTNARNPQPVLDVLNEADPRWRAERDAARQAAKDRSAHPGSRA